MGLSETVLERVAARLADQFGVPAEALRAPGVRVIAHGPALAEYHGVYVWAMSASAASADTSVIVSAPPALLDETQAALAEKAANTTGAALDPEFWRMTLGERMEGVVGPSYQGYLDAGVFRPLVDNPARMLTAGERASGALAALAAACPVDEWEHSAILPDDEPIFVVADAGGALLAAASLTGEGGDQVGVGVVTRPEARGRGLGRAVVSALSAWALPRGPVVHYQTLRANTGSVAIARSLGYQDVASALAVRLARDEVM